VFNVRSLGEIEEYTYEVWVRETIRRTQARLRNPVEEKAYEVSSGKLWRDMREDLRRRYDSDIV